MEFSTAADELYRVVPEEFVATRTRLVREAKAEGDAALAKRIGGLRRPTLSAWAVNLLARSAAGDLGRLLDVGARMREAWASGGGLGDLEQQRARLVAALLRRAGEIAAEAGRPLRDQAVREVEDTLQAATVDEEVAAEVREGRLPQPRSHTGFVPAGFALAPEPPPKEQSKPAPPEKPARREKKAERPKVTRTSAARARRAETLARKADEAERALADRAERADAAKRVADDASAEVGRLRHELDRATAERDSAARKAERAEQARARAEEAAREARKAAKEARRAADRDAAHG
ncbi:hypothetical protein [Actinomadura montaniterrae]|uniref:Uncharacterized protein n=1 Tax=Actinomadura montaniterrae TaxID=1803903 RepID=A0A6L3VN85_9ACTN|nr:hypothetical protein [Actinomadura montaniterrae]KAB2374806.1 hypothetical protein F9B16_27260 [Actinomadura montaniterrae]